MSQGNYTTELLGLKGVEIEEFWESDSEIKIFFRMQRVAQPCPRCHTQTRRIHDYRLRTIRDLELRGKALILCYNRRRFVCPECGKRFAENCTFAGKYQRFTHQVTLRIMELLLRRNSAKDIAALTRTSVSGVLRCLKHMPTMRPSRLPLAISFDEFKGNVNGEKFQCIVTDPLAHRVFDILPNRTVAGIQDYLKAFPNRDAVKYVVMDMNKGFRDVARTFLPNAKIIIDRFHVVRYCTWALDNVRRAFQKHLPDSQRKYFKRSRYLLLAHRKKLSEEDRLALDVLLRFSDKLAQAYALKEQFYSFMDAPNRETAEQRLELFLDACDKLMLPEFDDCRKMLKNWRPYILNAFDIPLSNGFTEGCNNAIKILKRVAFGFRNFHFFRARILLSLLPHPNI